MKKTHNLIPVIDRLGIVKAQLADLRVEEENLKTQLLEVGPGAYEGEFYRVTVTKPSTRDELDMDAVRKKLSPQFITAHTTTINVKSAVRVSARNGKSLEKVA